MGCGIGGNFDIGSIEAQPRPRNPALGASFINLSTYGGYCQDGSLEIPVAEEGVELVGKR